MVWSSSIPIESDVFHDESKLPNHFPSMFVDVKEAINPHSEESGVDKNDGDEDKLLGKKAWTLINENHGSEESDDWSAHFSSFQMSEDRVFERSEPKLDSKENEHDCDGDEHFYVKLFVGHENMDGSDNCFSNDVYKLPVISIWLQALIENQKSSLEPWGFVLAPLASKENESKNWKANCP